MSELRLYSFTHCYIASIQHGIQTGHMMGELFNNYVFDRDCAESTMEVVREWNKNHKTWITLNGGNSKGLREIVEFLEANPIVFDGVTLPCADFREDEDSMEGMRTAVGIILPEEIFNAIDYRTFMFRYGTPKTQEEYPKDKYADAWFWVSDYDLTTRVYTGDTPTGQLLAMKARCGLAR